MHSVFLMVFLNFFNIPGILISLLHPGFEKLFIILSPFFYRQFSYFQAIFFKNRVNTAHNKGLLFWQLLNAPFEPFIPRNEFLRKYAALNFTNELFNEIQRIKLRNVGRPSSANSISAIH